MQVIRQGEDPNYPRITCSRCYSELRVDRQRDVWTQSDGVRFVGRDCDEELINPREGITCPICHTFILMKRRV